MYVPGALRQRIRTAYELTGWASSRACAAEAKRLGYDVSHQTIENFNKGLTARTEKRVLRALMAVHGLDPVELAALVTDADLGGRPDPWTMVMPRRYWFYGAEQRERIKHALVALMDAMEPDTPK